MRGELGRVWDFWIGIVFCVNVIIIINLNIISEEVYRYMLIGIIIGKRLKGNFSIWWFIR